MKDSQELSLFEDYKQRHPDLVMGSDGFILTLEGASIFAAHISAERTRHLSSVLGGLAYGRSEKSLDRPVVVVEAPGENGVMAQAAGGIIDHLIAIEATTPDEVTEQEIDGLITRQARLITGSYVSVQSGDETKVVLSPTPSFEAK